MGLLTLNPVTAKRWRRFRSFKRAWYSLCLLALLYVLSLCSELICNSNPLFVWYGGRPYFPVFCHYSADEFLHNGETLAADYRELASNSEFVSAGGWMVWPPFSCGPNDRVPSEELVRYGRVNVHLAPKSRVGLVCVTGDPLMIEEFPGSESLLPGTEEVLGHRLGDFWQLPEDLKKRVSARLAGQADGPGEFTCKGMSGQPDVTMRLLAASASEPSSPVWIKVMDAGGKSSYQVRHLRFIRGEEEPDLGAEIMDGMDASSRSRIEAAVARAFEGGRAAVVPGSARVYGESAGDAGTSEDVLSMGDRSYRMICTLEQVSHPFRPVPGHWLGLDDAGRDVLARILYGLRTSLTFGLVLVVSSMLFGTMIGCLQGYLGGKVDMLGQRMIEIWSALPFLYVVILMGSLFGTGFWLLIVCYALFNWIGVSYYMRAEMLRLRRQPFVEAARCLGLPWWTVVWRHILPNALVPLVTFVPFSLVGAIGALAGLDYLGFGLPPPTPSLGQLLQQAQIQREAWWLILYPSVALFVVMLLCVFIGEGVREAFDPKRQSRIE